MCCRNDEGQWGGEGEQTTGKPQGEAEEAVEDDTENQLPVNTLFYGVRGQQVCQSARSGTITCHMAAIAGLVFLFLSCQHCMS